jgi:hypothetical protein
MEARILGTPAVVIKTSNIRVDEIANTRLTEHWVVRACFTMCGVSNRISSACRVSTLGEQEQKAAFPLATPAVALETAPEPISS